MDCLVTKLKEVVDDSRLLKMDEMEFVLSAGNMHIDLEVIGGGTATLIGDGYFTDSSYTQNNGKTLSLKSSGINNMYFKCNSECYLHTPKYSVKWVNIQSYAYIQGGIETLTFSDSLIVLYGGTSYGDIKCLKGKNLQQLSIPVDRYTGDIANLADSVSLTNLNATNSKIYGNISSLAGA